MPRPKLHANDSARAQAHRVNNFDRATIDIRKDAEINKAVMQAAASEHGTSLAGFIMEAVAAYIPLALGDDWLEKNGNHGEEINGAGGD